jgi:hypothetical protein
MECAVRWTMVSARGALNRGALRGGVGERKGEGGKGGGGKRSGGEKGDVCVSVEGGGGAAITKGKRWNALASSSAGKAERWRSSARSAILLSVRSKCRIRRPGPVGSATPASEEMALYASTWRNRTSASVRSTSVWIPPTRLVLHVTYQMLERCEA